jgi:transposase
MAKRSSSDPKSQALREQGLLHPHPDSVTDALFRQYDFFDARDLLQVKYEMLRRVEAEGLSVTAAAAAFGLSRPSFYEARAAWQREGLSGLLPKKRGPRGRHKLTPQVVAFLERERAQDVTASATSLALKVEAHFAVRVHPRSIERALLGREKKRR